MGGRFVYHGNEGMREGFLKVDIKVRGQVSLGRKEGIREGFFRTKMKRWWKVSL
jgi:hypothetical protein